MADLRKNCVVQDPFAVSGSEVTEVVRHEAVVNGNMDHNRKDVVGVTPLPEVDC